MVIPGVWARQGNTGVYKWVVLRVGYGKVADWVGFLTAIWVLHFWWCGTETQCI